MSSDNKAGAGAYKADQAKTAHVEAGDADRFRPPFHLHLGPDRDVRLGYRELAVGAGALGLGYLAFRGASALLGRGVKANATAAGHTGHVEPVPLARSATPEVKDNAAPRFAGDIDNRVDEPPFVATAAADDTAGLATGAADASAQTPEHVPTDLMGDKHPGFQDRAIDAFRPDPTAPVPEAMRDSLRPATGPAPSLAADRGTFAQGLSQTDGSK